MVHEIQPNETNKRMRMDSGVLVIGPLLPFGYRTLKIIIMDGFIKFFIQSDRNVVLKKC